MNVLWVACGIVCILSIVALLLKGALRLFACAARFHGDAALSVRRPWGPPSCDDPKILAESQEVLNRIRVRIAQRVATGIAVCLCLRALTMVLQLFEGRGFGGDAGLVAFVVAFSLTTLVACRPSTLTSRRLVALHVALMVAASVLVSPLGLDAAYNMLVFRPALMTATFFASFIGMSFRLVLATSILHHACLVWLYATLPPELKQDGMMSHIIASDFAVMCGKLAMIWTVQSSLELSALREVQAKLGQCERSAVFSLLGLVCDAVVEADAELKLLSDHLTFSGLLMHGAGKKLDGVPLKSFVVERDGPTSFESSIEKNVVGEHGAPTPGMFHGHIRDAIGNHIEVVFYHVPYRSALGGMHHMIGIRERGWDERRPLDVAPPALPEAVLREDVARSLEADSPESLPGQAGSGGSEAPEELKADVYIEEGLPICATTRAFRRAFGLRGRSDGSRSLLELLPCAEGLAPWLAQQAGALQGGGRLPCVRQFGELPAAASAQLGDARWVLVYFPAPPPPGAPARSRVSVRFRQGRAPSATSSERGSRGTPASVASELLPMPRRSRLRARL